MSFPPPSPYPQNPSDGYYNQPMGEPLQHYPQFPQGDLLQSIAQSPLSNLVTNYVGANLAGGQQIVESSIQRWLTDYKYYFNVNNSYVLNKLKVLLFPLRHKSWGRRIARQNDLDIYLPPKDDLNAPDLYIPSMALITYILLHGFVMGTTNRFTPEILGRTATTAIFSLFLEVLILKFGFYLLSDNAIPVSILDLVSYAGYIFVGVTFNTLVGVLAGKIVFYICTLITSLFMGIFMVKTLRILIVDKTYGDQGRNNFRNYFIVSIAALQILLSFFLSVVG